MKNHLIAMRYANALAEAVPDTTRLDTVLEQLAALAGVYVTHDDFRHCMDNRALPKEPRARVLDELLERIGADDEVYRLARLLFSKDRESVLPGIVEEFAIIVDRRLNRATASVTSAAPLSDEQRARLETALTKFSGKTVRLKCEVNPDLIGGVVARIGGQVIDGSLRTRLERLKHELIAQEI